MKRKNKHPRGGGVPEPEGTPAAPPGAADALSLARLDFACFCSAMRKDYRFPPHLKRLCSELEAVERGENLRLLVAMPPRHGKSLTATVMFTSWVLGRNPSKSVVLACHGEGLATDFGRAVRNILASPLYQTIFPEARLASDSAAVHRLATQAGGSFFGVGRGSALTGRGAWILIMDDVTKDAASADSESVRRATEAWFREVARTRLEPDGRIVAIGTRWRRNDFIGALMEDTVEGWKVLSFPAVAEPGDPLGRPEGAALWPERFNEAALRRIRAGMDARSWAAMYQGRAIAGEDGIFQLEWFGSFTVPPAQFSRTVIALDPNLKGAGGTDFSAMVVVGETTTGYYVRHVVRGRWAFGDLLQRIQVLAESWNVDAVLIEDTAAGAPAIETLRRESNLPILAVEPRGGKIERANAISPLCEAGRVHLPAAAGWLAEFTDEILAFPSGAHDDMVDALVMALSYLRAGDFFSNYTPEMYEAQIKMLDRLGLDPSQRDNGIEPPADDDTNSFWDGREKVTIYKG